MEKRHINYCGLGDSLTVGVGSNIFEKGFIGRYLFLTRKAFNQPIAPAVFARVGATTGDILKSFEHPLVCKTIKEAEIITITAGGNDLIDAAEQFLQDKKEEDFFIALESGKKNLSNIIQQIMTFKREAEPYIIRMINLYNPFPELKGSDKWVEAFNHDIERLANPPVIRVADIHDLFLGKEKELLANDHVHPNTKGYHLIANSLHQLGYEPLLS